MSEAAAHVVSLVMRLKASIFSLYVRHLQKCPSELGITGEGGAEPCEAFSCGDAAVFSVAVGAGVGGGGGNGSLCAATAIVTHLQLHSGLADSLLCMLRSKFRCVPVVGVAVFATVYGCLPADYKAMRRAFSAGNCCTA